MIETHRQTSNFEYSDTIYTCKQLSEIFTNVRSSLGQVERRAGWESVQPVFDSLEQRFPFPSFSRAAERALRDPQVSDELKSQLFAIIMTGAEIASRIFESKLQQHERDSGTYLGSVEYAAFAVGASHELLLPDRLEFLKWFMSPLYNHVATKLLKGPYPDIVSDLVRVQHKWREPDNLDIEAVARRAVAMGFDLSGTAYQLALDRGNGA